MRVVDTSAWIEGLIRGGNGNAISHELPLRSRWIVPTIVQLELAKWLSRNATYDEAAAIMAFTTRCIVVELTTPIALHAAELCRQCKLSTADAIIYATTLHTDADLLTCDALFMDLPRVHYLTKA
ncbi:type II toxin-antitoxin system VapC family toxin [Aquamicrobium sp. LC103]|uniref:type II toxin-antitoxin system VapC family toxin n=1 Tax=Aquamicrobium sp. LC103 TaxID=1120658 RepID=UPI00063E6D24|nr:type II toxin-antitoxin system VapC family toxin [Aquamicrobium sp. LC103]TKT80218.1 type II toxin-antitoxin system VapC family toxin [Aquamicrobium sp. LC103]